MFQMKTKSSTVWDTANQNSVQHRLFVLQEAIGPPNAVQPVDIQYAILLTHVLRQPQARITPALCKEDVRHIGLKEHDKPISVCWVMSIEKMNTFYWP